MPVDMFEWRFRQELTKLPPFTPLTHRDERVWPLHGSDAGKFPAWRALFSSLCLWGHSTGYRLFPYEKFFEYCKNAYCVAHPDSPSYKKYFEGELLEGMRQRISVWYESGMAETYLYTCLASTIEDKTRQGIVLYDPRADWKLKSDLIVILNRTPIRVSAYVGDQGDRPRIEARRDRIERERKINTSESAHWENMELKSMPLFEICRTDSDLQVVNGIRLFSIDAVNRLLSELYGCAAVKNGHYLS